MMKSRLITGCLSLSLFIQFSSSLEIMEGEEDLMMLIYDVHHFSNFS